MLCSRYHGSRNLGVSAVKLQKRRKMGFVFIITKVELFTCHKKNNVILVFCA